MREYYWEIVQFDGTTTRIPPTAVEVVKRRMGSGEPINTTSMVIPTNQIKSFRKTDTPFETTPLLESVAQAFKQPLISNEGEIDVRWVKKMVTQAKWDSYYSKLSYRRLGEFNGMVTVAFKLPVHLINAQMVDYCSEDEISQLEK